MAKSINKWHENGSQDFGCYLELVTHRLTSRISHNPLQKN